MFRTLRIQELNSTFEILDLRSSIINGCSLFQSGLETADCRLRTADWGLKTGDCRLRTEDWRLKTGDWGLETEDWVLVTGDWGLRTED